MQLLFTWAERDNVGSSDPDEEHKDNEDEDKDDVELVILATFLEFFLRIPPQHTALFLTLAAKNLETLEFSLPKII